MGDALVLSRYVSLVRLGPDLFLCGHAFRGPRNVVDVEQRAHLESFRAPLEVEAFLARHPAEARELLAARLEVWRRQGLLVEAGIDEDVQLQAEFGRHVETVKSGVRRSQMRARHDPRVRFRIGPTAVAPSAQDSWKVVYLGLCLVLPSADALVELGAEHGCEIQAIGSFPADLALIEEQRPDFIVVGDLPRVGLGFHDERPVQYVETLQALLLDIRRRSDAPILVRNLPGPTCSLGGLADRGPASHVNKVRTINIGIAALAEQVQDVHVVDIDQALALAGKNGLVDDMVVLSHHLASLTWLAERAARDPIAGSAHDAAELLRHVDVPRERLEAEYLLAGEDLRVMLALRAVGRRQVVVVDLDETLWPGLLAETGAPFPAALPVDIHPHHLYLGLHEALLALRDRGITLACVSKNDEELVKALWRYPSTLDHYPKLTLADFATYRINWNDKADNLLAIAAELDLGVDTFAFIDANRHERERVRARLPEVMVLGDNPFAVRWQLLTQPAFQVMRITDEPRRRPETMRRQLELEPAREPIQAVAPDAAAFVASLELRCTIRREHDDRHLLRVLELVHRTTQLNTTGEQPTMAELAPCTIYTLAAADRFADYGMVGACLTEGPLIRQLVLSCRVLGLGLEQVLLRAAAADAARRAIASVVEGRLIATPRNQPARHLFASCGFAPAADDPTRWTIDARTLDESDRPPFAVTLVGFDHTGGGGTVPT